MSSVSSEELKGVVVMILSVLNVQLLGSEKQGVTLVPACNPKQTEASHCMMNYRRETGHPVALYQNSI